MALNPNMTTRKRWKDMGFTVTEFKIQQLDNGRWQAHAIGKNTKGQIGIYLIATKDREATHRSEQEALASVTEWSYT